MALKLKSEESLSPGQKYVLHDVAQGLRQFFIPYSELSSSTCEDLVEPQLYEELGTDLALDPAIHPRGQRLLSEDGTQESVSWIYLAYHHRRFMGVVASGKLVVIRGTTIVLFPDPHPRERGPDAPSGTLFRRYVDWSDVLSQIGVVPSGRPLMTNPEGRSLVREVARLRTRS